MLMFVGHRPAVCGVPGWVCGTVKTWMFLTSPHGWVYGVSRKPNPVRPSTGASERRLFAKSQQQPGKPGSTEPAKPPRNIGQ